MAARATAHREWAVLGLAVPVVLAAHLALSAPVVLAAHLRVLVPRLAASSPSTMPCTALRVLGERFHQVCGAVNRGELT